MTTYNVRINSIYDELTAKERALLVLRSWNAGKDEDPAWRVRMPPEQTAEFNRYIHLMNGVNRELGLYLVAHRLETDKLNLRFGWLSESALWALATQTLRDYIATETREPVTESEHRKRVEAARAEFVPVADLAEALVEGYEGWTDDQLESRAEGIVKPDAWERVYREKVRELTRLVAEGVLQGKGKGARLKINNGSFYDWQGQETPAFPDRGVWFDVVPNEQAEDVAVRRRMREHAWEELERSPSMAVFHETYWPEELGRLLKALPRGQLDDVIDVSKGILRDGIEKRWREQRAIETMVAEAQEAFDGEDPCVPDVRHMIDHVREALVELHESLQDYVGPFDLPEPDEETLEVVRALYERGR